MPKVLIHDSLGQYASPTESMKRVATLDVDGILVGDPAGLFFTSVARVDGTAYKEYVGATIGLGPTYKVTPASAKGCVGWRGAVGLTGNMGDVVIIHDAAGTIQLHVRLESNGRFGVYRGSGTGNLIVESAPAAVTHGGRYFMEFFFDIHASTGVVKFYVNEVQVLTSSGNTQAAATATWGQVTARAQPSAWGDFYIADATDMGDGFGGHAPYGDCRSDWHAVDSTGTYDQWTPLSGTNKSQVDEIPADDDTTYNETLSTGNKDSFGHENLKNPGATIICVTDVFKAKKVAAGTARVGGMCRMSTTDFLSAVEFSPSPDQWEHYTTGARMRNPLTTAAWTEGQFNTGHEVGYYKSA